MNYYVYIDKELCLAHTDNGEVFQIESFHDDQDEPCLPEDAVYLYVRSGETSFDKVDLEREDDAFD